VPLARGLARGQHQVHISAGQGALIDGFVVQDRPAWPLGWAAGAVVVGLAGLGWLMVWQGLGLRKLAKSQKT
jgi:hypothetical protein